MVEINPETVESFTTSIELEEWLRANHDRSEELWIRIFKKGTRIPSVTWDEVVIECLCWGWIDGMRKSEGDKAYLQRITPRRKNSPWSKRNRQHAERLIEQGRMQDSGLIQVSRAKQNGRWADAYTASEMTVPQDFIEALEGSQRAKETFELLNSADRYTIALGLTSAKRPETRLRRFERYLELLRAGKTPNYRLNRPMIPGAGMSCAGFHEHLKARANAVDTRQWLRCRAAVREAMERRHLYIHLEPRGKLLGHLEPSF